jgi:hypothetical protein
MSAEHEQVIAGFPEFWQQVYRRFPRFFEAARQLEPIHNKIFRIPVREALHVVVGRIAIGVSNSFGALITLALNGYGADAMRVVRSMFEGEVTAAYLRRHPDKLNDYVDFIWIRQKSLLKYMERYAPQQLQRVASERVAETHKQFATVAPRFRSRDGRLLPRWTAVTVREMAEEAGLGQLYLTVYSWACAMHHADFQGLAFLSERRTLDAAVAPSEDWLETALVSGHGSTLRVLLCYSEVAKLGMDAELDEARRAFLSAWKT